ncbi:hypothetical protein R1flu_028255 [Riccia fluitans]|uniref:Uncharacterized protein n=1 Tax=Riccia fluitans TaxID=41844 RepID=A0ABD1XL49_9MARC
MYRALVEFRAALADATDLELFFLCMWVWVVSLARVFCRLATLLENRLGLPGNNEGQDAGSCRGDGGVMHKRTSDSQEAGSCRVDGGVAHERTIDSDPGS